MPIRFGLFCAALIGWCATAQAGAPQPFSEDLTLDWGGFRSDLLEKGIDFRVGYVSETATNVQGGDNELWRYADQLTFAATLDLQKLLGLKQAQFKITITDRNGRNLGADAKLGSLEEVEEIYAVCPSPRRRRSKYRRCDSRAKTIGQLLKARKEPMRRLALAAPTDTKASTDTIVQWIRLYESGVIASVFGVSHPIESETHNRQFF